MVHNSRTCPWPPSRPRKGFYVDSPNGVAPRKGRREYACFGASQPSSDVEAALRTEPRPTSTTVCNDSSHSEPRGDRQAEGSTENQPHVHKHTVNHHCFASRSIVT